MSIVRFEPNGTMSRAVVANGFLFIGGTTPDNRSADIKGQTDQVLAKIDFYLAEAGLTRKNLVNVQVWLRDIHNDFDAMNALWNNWVDKDNLPCRATVESKLRYDDLLVEISAIAVM